MTLVYVQLKDGTIITGHDIEIMPLEEVQLMDREEYNEKIIELLETPVTKKITKEELIVKATELGIEFDAKISKKDLELLIAEKEQSEN